MKTPGKRLSCVLIGVVAQLPALLVLVNGVLDMHNRFSVLLSSVLPYAAIVDRFKQPPTALMFVVLAVTVFQYPLYGAIIGDGWTKGRLLSTFVVVALVHAAAAAVAIYMKIAMVRRSY